MARVYEDSTITKLSVYFEIQDKLYGYSSLDTITGLNTGN